MRTVLCAAATAGIAFASFAFFSKILIEYAVSSVVTCLFLLFITFLTGRRAFDFQRLKTKDEDRISIWYLSSKEAAASAHYAAKKFSSLPVRISLLVLLALVVIGGVSAAVFRNIRLFISVLVPALLQFAAVLLTYFSDLYKMKLSKGICVFGYFGAYVNGLYYSFCDIGIEDVSAGFNNKYSLMKIYYRNNFLSGGDRCVIPVYVPIEYEAQALKIVAYYAEYEY